MLITDFPTHLIAKNISHIFNENPYGVLEVLMHRSKGHHQAKSSVLNYLEGKIKKEWKILSVIIILKMEKKVIK